MANLLSLDIGDKRIGVAIADMDAPFPAPLVTLEASEQLASEFKDILKKHSVVAIVIGYPRNQKGEPTAQTERVQHIAKLLNIPEDIPTYWQDESLTSVKAEDELKKRKKPYDKSAIDSLAATYILDDFIKTQASGQPQTELTPEEKQESSKKGKKKKSKKKKHPLVQMLFVILGLLLIAAAVVIGWYIYSLTPRTTDDQYSVISVKQGSSTVQIAQELEKQKVIRSSKAFSLYVKLSRTKSLQAGEYRLSSRQSVKTIVDTISGGKVTTVNVLVSPGLRLDQILTALEKEGYEKADLEAALVTVRDHPLLKDVPKDTKLEGYLFPDTYQIGPSTTAEELFRLMLDNFQKQITADLLAQIQGQGLTLKQAVIMASIVQKEVKDEKVQPTVAQVFIKRFKIDMMLGSDVTYMYVGGLTGKTVDPSLDSPYNTRRFKGLPPTPISNFNLSALNAVANPSKTDYLYFVAGDDGQTYFSKTVEEHEALVERHCKTLCG